MVDTSWCYGTQATWHAEECTHISGWEHRACLGTGAWAALGWINTIAHSWRPALFRRPFLRSKDWGFSLLSPSSHSFLITHSLPKTTPTSHFPFFPLTQIIASHGSLNIAPGLFSRCWGLDIFLMSFQLPLCSCFPFFFLTFFFFFLPETPTLYLPGSSCLPCFLNS